jgi:hypothetical protein
MLSSLRGHAPSLLPMSKGSASLEADWHQPWSLTITKYLEVNPATFCPPQLWNTVCLIILWKIWDSRNDKIFRQIDQLPRSTIRNIISDLTLLSYRFKKTDQRLGADLWRNHLSNCIL